MGALSFVKLLRQTRQRIELYILLLAVGTMHKEKFTSTDESTGEQAKFENSRLIYIIEIWISSRF